MKQGAGRGYSSVYCGLCLGAVKQGFGVRVEHGGALLMLLTSKFLKVMRCHGWFVFYI